MGGGGEVSTVLEWLTVCVDYTVLICYNITNAVSKRGNGMYDLNITTNEEIAEKYEDSTFSIEDIQADIYEITVDGEFAGFIAYTIENVPELGWTAYVEAVELLEKFQGQGIYRQICADLMESEELDAIAGENKGAKGVEYRNIIIGGSRVYSLWVRFNNQD